MNELDSQKIATESLTKKMQLTFNFKTEIASNVQLRLDLLKPYKANMDILKITFINKSNVPVDLNLLDMHTNVDIHQNSNGQQLSGANIEIYFNNPIKNFNQIKIEIQINEIV